MKLYRNIAKYIVQTEMVNYCTDMSVVLYGRRILSALLWCSVFIARERQREWWFNTGSTLRYWNIFLEKGNIADNCVSFVCWNKELVHWQGQASIFRDQCNESGQRWYWYWFNTIIMPALLCHKEPPFITSYKLRVERMNAEDISSGGRVRSPAISP